MRKQVLKAVWGLALSLALATWLAQGDDLGGDVGWTPAAGTPEAVALGTVAPQTSAAGNGDGTGTTGTETPASKTTAREAPADGAPGVGRVEGGGRRMAVTFDDLPAVSVLQPGAAGQREILEPIRRTLVERKVPATGFVNESKLYRDGKPDPERVALLAGWLDAGLALGNHTFSHPDLHHTPLDEWLADAARGEEVTRRLMAERGGELAWFRHPYLHTGRSLETKRAVEDFLATRGQRVAPVTVDNDEYLFAAAWDRAGDRGDRRTQRRVEEAYVPYMVAKVAYYEEQSRQLFGREIPLVLLLHANSINARRFGELAEALEQRGYGFVPLEEAVADPVYDSPDTYAGPAGISWIHRWAITREVDRAMFRGEPDVPDWLREAARPERP